MCGMSFYFGSIQTAENAEDVQGANMGVLEVVITAAMILLATGLSVILVNRKFKQESIELLNRKVIKVHDLLTVCSMVSILKAV